MGKPRGLYTPVYASLPRHPKILQAATALRIDRMRLVGHMVALWTWCLDSVPSEGGITAEMVALGAEWPKRSANRFASSLADAGLLDRVDGFPDRYEPHDWREYGGKVAREKAYDRERKSQKTPGDFRGNDAVDETRRDETRSDLVGVGGAGQTGPLTIEQSALLLALHRGIADRVFGGSGAPPSGWCEDLIRRGATPSDVECAIVAMRPELGARARGLPYGRAVIERRVKEREHGHDPDERPAGGAGTARRGAHGGPPGPRGVAAGGAGRDPAARSEYSEDFTV